MKDNAPPLLHQEGRGVSVVVARGCATLSSTDNVMRMEDGPEEAEGSYEYNGEKYRLVEQDSERWQVYGGGVYLGVVAAVAGSDGPEYTIDLAGEEGQTDEPSTDDWRRALETLIDKAG